ncbi:MAG: hypothetical protein CUN54_05115 [Phototrophicales bacterium]|nr:MAG: hypothetical protein CUN54_05115 [Phototrophicales bacterium]
MQRRGVVFSGAMILVLAIGIWLTTSDAQDSENNVPTTTSINAETPLEPIVIPISLYLLEDAGDEETAFSTRRSVEEVEEILVGMNDIWSQASIELQPRFIGTIQVPEEILRQIAQGNFTPFYNATATIIDVPQPGMINGFYAREIGGANGITPGGIGSRTFFVMDDPSVHDRRVSSHEVGHILGLHHTLESAERLLFPGTNGMTLTEEEIVVARYVAQGMLDRQR